MKALLKHEVMWFRDEEIRIRRRAFQRSLRLHVKPNGEILVTAGLTLPHQVISRFLNDAWRWVEEKRIDAREIRSRIPAKRFCQGESFLLHGQRHDLHFVPSSAQRMAIELEGQRFIAKVPRSNWAAFDPMRPHPEWHGPFRRFYKAQAEILIPGRVQALSARLQLFPSHTALRCQKTRWGSCAPNGRLSLNWKLIAAPTATLDYVIIHELAHLKHANHGVDFWRLVATHCPEFKSHVNWLRQYHFELDFLSARSDLHRL